MKNLSSKASLSKIYTNHSIWHTVVTTLDEKYEAHHIMAQTGHKSENSIKNYSKKCSSTKKREMSDELAAKMNIKKPKSNESLAPLDKKSKPTSTVSVLTTDTKITNAINAPTFGLTDSFDTIDKNEFDKIFSDDNIVDIVNQIENENQSQVGTTPFSNKQ